MKRLAEILSLVLLFLVSFVFFLYITFPYEVVKETVAAQISEATGLNVRIGGLGPNFPLGIEAEQVRVTTRDGSGSLKFDGVEAGVGLFSVLTGSLAVDIALEEMGGQLEVDLKIPIGDALAGNPVPSNIVIDSSQFPIDGLASFGIAMAASADPMAGPLMAKIGVSGRLNGAVDFDLDSDNPTQSQGVATLTLDKAILVLSDPSLGLTDQVFRKALVKANVNNGRLVIDKTSGFVSDELSVAMAGQIDLKQRLAMSLIDMNVQFKMDKGLKEKFGFVIGMILGDPTRDSQMTVQVKGSVASPQVTTF